MYTKTYHAPTHEERAREASVRFVRDAERRKLDAIKAEQKRLRQVDKLEREGEKLHSRSLGIPSSPYLRARSSSFSGVGSSPYLGYSIGQPSVLGGPGVGSPRIGIRSHELVRDQQRPREADLARQRRQVLTVEALERQRTASILARDQRALAQMHSPYGVLGHSDGHHAYGHASLGVPVGSPLLRRSRSFGSLPPRSDVHRLRSYAPPLAYSRAMSQYPRLSPRLDAHLPGDAPNFRPSATPYHRPPSPPRVVNNNYSIYNGSPHLDPCDLSYGSPRLEGYAAGGYVDDFGQAGMRSFDPRVDPHVYDVQGIGGGGRYVELARNDIVVTDLSFAEDGRQILSELGFVEGTSAALSGSTATEDERLDLAITNLTQNAQYRGANAVLSVETGEDAAGMGEIIIRGRAVFLG